MNKGVYFECGNFEPHFCSFCGDRLNLDNHFAKQDFNAQASHTCNCSARYIQTNREQLDKELQEEIERYEK